jgi:hypothetical protein
MSLWSQLRRRISFTLLNTCCESSSGLRVDRLEGFINFDEAETGAGKSLLTAPERFSGTWRVRSSPKTRLRSRESPLPTVEKCGGLLNERLEERGWDGGGLRA